MGGWGGGCCAPKTVCRCPKPVCRGPKPVCRGPKMVCRDPKRTPPTTHSEYTTTHEGNLKPWRSLATFLGVRKQQLPVTDTRKTQKRVKIGQVRAQNSYRRALPTALDRHAKNKLEGRDGILEKENLFDFVLTHFTKICAPRHTHRHCRAVRALREVHKCPHDKGITPWVPNQSAFI